MIRLAIPTNRKPALSKVPTLRAGQSYERRVSAWLEHEYGMVSQVEFERVGPNLARSRFIPDGLLFNPEYTRLVVVEIKSQNSEIAYKQLRDYVRWLYEWFNKPVSGLLVCASDPFPLSLDYRMVAGPLDAFDKPFALLAMSARMLPRMRNGMGGRESNSHLALWPGGSAGHCAARLLSSTDVAANARTRSP